MKKILTLTLIIGLFACSSSKPKPAGDLQNVIGTVAVNESQVLIEQLEFTRSKKSFDVSGSLKDQVAALKGKTITVKGYVVTHSPFAASIEVTEIVK